MIDRSLLTTIHQACAFAFFPSFGMFFATYLLWSFCEFLRLMLLWRQKVSNLRGLLNCTALRRSLPPCAAGFETIWHSSDQTMTKETTRWRRAAQFSVSQINLCCEVCSLAPEWVRACASNADIYCVIQFSEKLSDEIGMLEKVILLSRVFPHLPSKNL